MKILAIIGDANGEWGEPFQVTDVSCAEEEIEKILHRFNDNLRPYETKRHLVRIITNTNTKQAMENVQMSAEERAEFEAFKAEKEKKAAAEKARQDREAYKQLVDETVNALFPGLEEISGLLAQRKKEAYKRFQQALVMKAELYENAIENKSNTFINKEGTRRITLGQYEVDAYDDTVNEGINKVKAFIESLAKDDNSRMLVSAILKLLTKDKKGNLKASRVMQLRKMADDSGNDQFLDGVRIIEAAYRPTVSKFYIKAERKQENGEWVAVPLGMTEA